MKNPSEYKVDSTKGSALMNPVNFKGDVLVQVWMDSRVLATLCKWLEREGEYPRFMSEIIRRPLEMMAMYAVDQDGAEMIGDTVEARDLLRVRFRVNLNKGDRGGRNILHNKILTERIKEGIGQGSEIESSELPRKLSQEDVRREARRKQMVERAVGVYNEILDKETRESIAKQKEAALNSGIVVKEGEFNEMSDEEFQAKLAERDKVIIEKEKVPVKPEDFKLTTGETDP